MPLFKDLIAKTMAECEKLVQHLVRSIDQCMEDGCKWKATHLVQPLSEDARVLCNNHAAKTIKQGDPMGTLACITCGTFGATNNKSLQAPGARPVQDL